MAHEFSLGNERVYTIPYRWKGTTHKFIRAQQLKELDTSRDDRVLGPEPIHSGRCDHKQERRNMSLTYDHVRQ